MAERGASEVCQHCTAGRIGICRREKVRVGEQAVVLAVAHASSGYRAVEVGHLDDVVVVHGSFEKPGCVGELDYLLDIVTDNSERSDLAGLISRYDTPAGVVAAVRMWVRDTISIDDVTIIAIRREPA